LLSPARRLPRTSTLPPYTTLCRSGWCWAGKRTCERLSGRWSEHPKCAKSGSRGGTGSPVDRGRGTTHRNSGRLLPGGRGRTVTRSEEHTSELQSRFDLVCRLLLEK